MSHEVITEVKKVIEHCNKSYKAKILICLRWLMNTLWFYNERKTSTGSYPALGQSQQNSTDVS